MSLKERMRGVLGFPLTPFHQDLSVDADALAANVDEMARHPYCALVAAGGMGEIYSLTPDEIVEVVRVTVEATAGRMPVVAGLAFNAAIGAELARRLEKAGADCLLVLPPYYAQAPEQGMVEYYAAIANASGLPLMLYSRGWASFSPQQVARLADRIPTLQLWKDGQGDTRKFQRIMQHVGDRLVWLGGLGDDCVPAYFSLGVQAYTSSISNIAPKLSVMLGEAGIAGDFGRLNTLREKYVHPLYAIRERSHGYEVAVMKEAMEILGRRAGPVRPPLVACEPQDVEDIRRLMEVYRDVIEEREPGKPAVRSRSERAGIHR